MTFTESQKEKIKSNLNAYLANFKPITIEKADYGKGFYVYEVDRDGHVQYCENIDYLNGWLYGAVQARNKIITTKENI